MGIIAWIVVGLIAGFIAEKVMGRDHGLLTNLIVGVIGAFVGGFIVSTLLGFEFVEGLNLATIVTATIGAIVFLWIWGMIRGRSSA